MKPLRIGYDDDEKVEGFLRILDEGRLMKIVPSVILFYFNEWLKKYT